MDDSDAQRCRKHYSATARCLRGGLKTWIAACRDIADGTIKDKHIMNYRIN
jgi:hypothetical protein